MFAHMRCSGGQWYQKLCINGSDEIKTNTPTTDVRNQNKNLKKKARNRKRRLDGATENQQERLVCEVS